MRKDVLDHGYVELVETWGSDERIIEAARMSTGKGFLGWGPMTCAACHDDTETIELKAGWLGEGKGEPGARTQPCHRCDGSKEVPGDEKLLAFLWKNAHATPFEMAGAIFEVQAPIMTFREWHRHRTQSYNELSARYTSLPDVNYVPTIDRMMVNSKTNKQAGTAAGAADLDKLNAEEWLVDYKRALDLAQDVYARGLKYGLPKELARLPVPVARYSRMRASANLRNWLAFLTLRDDVKAQWEIQQYAGAVRDMLSERFPRTLALFQENR